MPTGSACVGEEAQHVSIVPARDQDPGKGTDARHRRRRDAGLGGDALMGWSVGYDSNWNRDIGYGVPAYCDHPGCGEVIDRGLSYVCGGAPYGGEHGCGLFFCSAHRRMAGDARNGVQLCTRCRYGKPSTHAATADHPRWMRHKLDDASWKAWRAENPQLVEAIRDQLRATARELVQ
ncbi:hypothetical protein ABE488_09205 [Luteimonas sp. TWI662]|uniref:hypothetical protein n=1 Tax=Luteimonas sp. TWI662 TaxID=3136789 RepID=UPI0032088EEE